MSLSTSDYVEAKERIESYAEMKNGWYGDCPCCESKAPTSAAIDSALLILDALRDAIDSCRVSPLIDGGVSFEIEKKGMSLIIDIEDDPSMTRSAWATQQASKSDGT